MPSRTGAAQAQVEDQTLLLRRSFQGHELLVVASFAEGAVSATLPAGKWRLLLDSGDTEIKGARAGLRGHHAIVLEKTGIELHPEVKIVGESK